MYTTSVHTPYSVASGRGPLKSEITSPGAMPGTTAPNRRSTERSNAPAPRQLWLGRDSRRRRSGRGFPGTLSWSAGVGGGARGPVFGPRWERARWKVPTTRAGSGRTAGAPRRAGFTESPKLVQARPEQGRTGGIRLDGRLRSPSFASCPDEYGGGYEVLAYQVERHPRTGTAPSGGSAPLLPPRRGLAGRLAGTVSSLSRSRQPWSPVPKRLPELARLTLIRPGYGSGGPVGGH